MTHRPDVEKGGAADEADARSEWRIRTRAGLKSMKHGRPVCVACVVVNDGQPIGKQRLCAVCDPGRERLRQLRFELRQRELNLKRQAEKDKPKARKALPRPAEATERAARKSDPPVSRVHLGSSYTLTC